MFILFQFLKKYLCRLLLEEHFFLFNIFSNKNEILQRKNLINSTETFKLLTNARDKII